MTAARAPSKLWTIGYERRDLATIVDALRVAGVVQVIDVRQHVVSRFKPEFRGSALRSELKAAGLEYVHVRGVGNPFSKQMKEPGGFERGAAFYREHLHAQYEAVAEVIDHAWQTSSALMCICADAEQCHRGILVQRIMALVPDLRVVHLLQPEASRASKRVRA